VVELVDTRDLKSLGR